MIKITQKEFMIGLKRIRCVFMSNPKVSVIVPVYNIEYYLEESLNCLVNQTIFDEIEVFMIDDGSTDNSRYIIDKFDFKYNNKTDEEIYATRFHPDRTAVLLYGITAARSFA